MNRKRFNTSYITINLVGAAYAAGTSLGFNTSYITINQLSDNIILYRKIVSIHPILLLIDIGIYNGSSGTSFNTSYITINPKRDIRQTLNDLCFNTSYITINLLLFLHQ